MSGLPNGRPAGWLRRALNRMPVTRRAAAAARGLRSARVILGSGLFDAEWYAAQAGRRFAGRRAACLDYVVRGRRAGLSPHPLVEPEWILPERWRTERVDPLAMVLRHPRHRMRQPHPLFDPATWVRAHPEAATHPHGPLGHFVATADDATLLPAVDAAGSPVALTWGGARAELWRSLRRWRDQEELRRAPRVTPDYDRAAERAFLARWSAAPLPPRDTGPLVSVVMAVRNRADRVGAAVASVRAQRLEDWELVVVDDGSTDATPAAVERAAAGDPRVRLLRQPPTGVSAARNRGLAAAAGRYVAFLDSDNTWRPHFLRTAVAALHGQGRALGYAALHQDVAGNSAYRAFGGTAEHLRVQNHVDLNVLVAERSVVAAAGGFAEDLRRTVDHDLVLRLLDRHAPAYLPFVGADYAADADDAGRITVAEPPAWREVVKARRLVDWPGLAAGERVPGRVSLLLPAWGWIAAWRAAGALAAPGGPDPHALDLELVVVDTAVSRATAMLLAALALVDPRVVLRRSPIDLGLALATDVALEAATGDVVVALDHDVEPRRGDVARLVAALDDPGVVAATPLLLARDATVASAGRFRLPSGGRHDLLRGHSVADAFRLGTVDVAAPGGGALAVRAADLVAARGLDPLVADDDALADVALRLRQPPPAGSGTGGRVVTVADATLLRHGEPRGRDVRGGPARPTVDARLPVTEPAALAALYARAGLDVVPDHVPGLRVRPRPAAARPRRAGGPPALRWALKTAAPAARRLAWGDTHFAQALADALERLGQHVAVDCWEAHDRPSAGLDDVVLVLRGRVPVAPRPSQLSLLWVISHPDEVSPAEVASYDAAFAASLSWSRGMTERAGRRVEPLLQCTDPRRFHPGAGTPGTGAPVLFVGNSRGVDRAVVRWAVAAGADVHVYGSQWERFLDPRHHRGDYLPNERLAAAYRSAGVVLNDHWDDMRRGGFLSNRLFDVVAAGGRVVSDPVDGLEEVLGDLVATYTGPAELAGLLRRPPSAVPGEERVLAASEAVRREHSFDARARRLLECVLALREARPPPP